MRVGGFSKKKWWMGFKAPQETLNKSMVGEPHGTSLAFDRVGPGYLGVAADGVQRCLVGGSPEGSHHHTMLKTANPRVLSFGGFASRLAVPIPMGPLCIPMTHEKYKHIMSNPG